MPAIIFRISFSPLYCCHFAMIFHDAIISLAPPMAD
jgi:hypothetical protein